jgi:hypothetical protein
MARGWESKSIESQMEESGSERKPAAKRLTPEGAAALRRKETLLLARAHLQQQMQASRQPRYRQMLEAALAELDKQLAQADTLETPGSR